ncbi:MAG TPA: Wzz/FepE/Etk N-terminal domain-containing protein [Steroidobacteraceae bacterium]
MRRQTNLPVLSAGAPREIEREIAQPDDETRSSISPNQILQVLWAYRKHTAVIFLSLLALAVIAIKLLPKTYQATATLMVNTDIRDPLAGKDPTGVTGGYIPTEIQLMASPEVLLPVIDQLKLTTVKEYIAGYRGNGDDASLRDWVKQKLQSDLEISQGAEGSLLINITASAREPLRAAAIANGIADVYMQEQKQRLEDPAVYRAKRYSEQLAELKQKVSIAQDQVAQFRQRTGIIDMSTQKNVESEVLGVMEHRLDDAQNERRAAEVRGMGNQAVSGGVMSSATIQGLKKELAAQQVKLAQLTSTLGTQHPKVLELQSQIDATKQSLAAEMRTYSSSTTEEVIAAREFERKQQAAIEVQRAKVLALRKQQDEGNKYTLELDSAESVYKRALDGYDQTMFASAGHYNYVNLVSRAVIPLESKKPNKLKLLIAALLFSLAAGVAAPGCYELLVDRRIRCIEDLERSFGVPVLVEFNAIHLSPSAA